MYGTTAEIGTCTAASTLKKFKLQKRPACFLYEACRAFLCCGMLGVCRHLRRIGAPHPSPHFQIPSFCLLLSPKSPITPISTANTGQGSIAFARRIKDAPGVDTLEDHRLRFTMPSALCSYCTGQTRIGDRYCMGNVREMDLKR